MMDASSKKMILHHVAQESNKTALQRIASYNNNNNNTQFIKRHNAVRGYRGVEELLLHVIHVVSCQKW